MYKRQLLGGGVTATNHVFQGEPCQIGWFDAINTNLGIDSGVVMCTGDIYELDPIIGSAFPFIPNTVVDPDLLAVANSVPGLIGQSFSVSSVNDIAVLEFDFVPTSDSLEFRYAFGSQEYFGWENSAYNDLVSLYRRIGIINDAIAILDWDQSTIMPEGSASARSEQLATLSVLSHDLLTHPKISELLDKVDFNKGKIDSWKVANLEGMKRAHLHAISVPADLVKEQSRANSTCQMEWRKAKQENDFAFCPEVTTKLSKMKEKIIEVTISYHGLSLIHI